MIARIPADPQKRLEFHHTAGGLARFGLLTLLPFVWMFIAVATEAGLLPTHTIHMLAGSLAFFGGTGAFLSITSMEELARLDKRDRKEEGG